jgi:hypothetical protein
LIRPQTFDLALVALLALVFCGGDAEANGRLLPPDLPDHVVLTDSSGTLERATAGSLSIYREVPLELSAALAEREEQRSRPMNWQRLADEVDLTPNYSRFSQGLATAQSYEDNRGLNANGMAMVLQKEYGAGSMLGRSALTIARWAEFYETRTQMPLDKMNVATDTIVEKARIAFRMPNIPVLNLRSQVSTKGVEIGFRHRW